MAGQDDATVPGLQLDSKLEAKLDSLDDHLEPVEKELKESGKEAKEDPKAEKTEPEDDAKPTEKPVEEESAESGKEGESDEGYTIDESEPEEEEPVKTDENLDTSNLTTEDKYVLDNITKFTVSGKLDGKQVSYDVYSVSQIPNGFEYDNLALALKADNLNESKAEKLRSDFRTQETQKSADEFKQREDKADRADIADLQRAGEIPKFKVTDAESPDFNKDPGVKLSQEVLDFKEKQNQKYMDEYNAGRPYKHIGFIEAFRMFQRENPTTNAQTKEDQERLDVAKRTSKTNGSSSEGERPKARAHSGMTGMDLEALIESKTAGW